jgi:hypothetical protein
LVADAIRNASVIASCSETSNAITFSAFLSWAASAAAVSSSTARSDAVISS